MSISAARRPASKAGHSTLVSAGVSISAYWEAITERTEKSSGTRRSAWRRAASRPLNWPPVVIAAVQVGSVARSSAATAWASCGGWGQLRWMPRMPASAHPFSNASWAMSADV